MARLDDLRLHLLGAGERRIEVVDVERRFRPGRIAIEQRHEGSVVEVRARLIRERAR